MGGGGGGVRESVLVVVCVWWWCASVKRVWEGIGAGDGVWDNRGVKGIMRVLILVEVFSGERGVGWLPYLARFP